MAVRPTTMLMTLLLKVPAWGHAPRLDGSKHCMISAAAAERAEGHPTRDVLAHRH
jgi:hypothetical protein